ncbi:hypothetical protein IR145_04395, partial [Streptococcus danieliae]|nr:hypothetical protein [Streptococcus danieliae]
ITDSIRLPEILHCIKFIQFLVLVDGTDSLADVAGKHAEQVGYLLLRHPYGYGRHRDRTRFTDCYYSSIHCHLILVSSFDAHSFFQPL